MNGLGIDIGLRIGAGARWWPQEAGFAADFLRRRFMSGGQHRAFGEVMSFARSSPAAALDSTGLCLAYASGAPRLTDAGLLLEGGATNMLRKSSDLGDDSAWIAEGYATVTGNKQAFGALVLEECAVTGPSAFPKFKSVDSLILADGEYGVVSFFALPGAAGPLRTHVSDGSSNTATSWTVSGSGFAKSGVIANNPARTQHTADGMETYPSGLHRLWTAFRNVSGTPLTYHAHTHIQGTTGVSAMASACWMGGHQLEKGRWPTSPILTQGSPVTRAADNLTISATTAGVGAAPSMAIRARWLGGHASFPWLFSLNDGTAANEIGLYIAANAASLNRKVNTGGISQADGSTGIAGLVHGDHLTAALHVAPDNLETWARRNTGTAIASSDNTVTMPAYTQLQLGAGQGGSNTAALLVERFHTGNGWGGVVLSNWATA